MYGIDAVKGVYMTIPQKELFIPRTWHGSHIGGLPGYELVVDDGFVVSIAVQSSGIISGIIAQESAEVRFWAESMEEMMQWVANTIKFPVSYDEEEAIYPADDFDDGDNEDFEEEPFDDGDDEEVNDESLEEDAEDEPKEPVKEPESASKSVDKKKKEK